MTPLDLHFKPKVKVIDERQIEQIHMATLEVLERTGVVFHHPRALEVLDGAGAWVDGGRVRIPAWLVEDSIRHAPKRIVLGSRDGTRSVVLEGDNSWFGPSLDCIDYLDPVTEERRPFTSDDCRITATIADALPNFTWVMTIGMADDTEADIADRVIARQVLTHCTKPFVFCCKDVNSARDIYEMALLIVGGEENFRRTPSLVHYSEPISPLSYFGPAVEKIIYCAETGIPVINFPAPQAGGTGPATFAGNIVQGSAESLSGLVLAQLVRPGAPFIYGAFTTIMDMKTTIFSYGAPEMSLMTAAVSQMAQYYRLPFFGTAGCTDAKFPDPQAAAEVAFSCLSSALAGANLVHDAGSWIDHGSLVSPAFMVLVNEVLDMVKQYMHGISVNKETLAIELIDRIGPGGHYLDEDHTMRHFRDVWYSNLFDRTIYDVWQQQGAKRFEERLREKTLEAMDHKPVALSSEIVKELDRMAEHWE
ncbi:MAG: trimethylamine methyltransferase family protein [Desulfobacterales bacterium]|jgi:trimethylamine--corrinoid protein Co-methyltransferase